MSRDHRAFAQELHADAAILEDMARSLRSRADEHERPAIEIDPAIAREAERITEIRDLTGGGFIGLSRHPNGASSS